jgi:hypothetical protein
VASGPHLSPARRARRSFWVLVTVAILAAGSLSAAVTSAPSPGTGLRVAGSGVLLILTIGLAARVQTALVRADRRSNSSMQTATGAPTDPSSKPRERRAS